MSNPRVYQETRRDEIAREYMSCDYSSAETLERRLIDYCLEIESRFTEATGTDMRAEWISRLTEGTNK